MTAKLDGGDALLYAIRDLKVDYILSSPGTEWAAIWEAMAKQIDEGRPGPKFMDCWHETLAVDIASGYTLATGKMQAVLLHAGAGLLQGLMGVHGALLTGVPMLVISGESTTFGETPGFDPGAQWVNNLSIVGGPQTLIAPLVKYACQTASPNTMYESIVRAGEMAQRVPAGPTYLSIPHETLVAEWTPSARRREVPDAPRLVCAQEDIRQVAELIARADNPVVLTEGAGRDPQAFHALVALSEKAGLPVVETPGSLFTNFPTDHPMYQGHDFGPYFKEADLILVISTRAPWYKPSNWPPHAAIVNIDEVPHRPYMAYQSHGANFYLEGDIASTLADLAQALDGIDLDASRVAQRKAKASAAHDALMQSRLALQADARKNPQIDPVWLCTALNEVFPDDTMYLEEVTTHLGVIRQNVKRNKPQTLFARQGGLGQGLGLALGLKLGHPERTAITLIGDGAFLYNPVLQSLGAARDFDLPIIVVLFNNKKYAAMQGTHKRTYPDGVAVKTDTFFGTHINGPDYVKIIESFGGYGEVVSDPDDLVAALKRGYEANKNGKTVVLDIRVSK